MNITGNETLTRIQQEIKEALEREEQLRSEYAKKAAAATENNVAVEIVDVPHSHQNGIVKINGINGSNSSTTTITSSKMVNPPTISQRQQQPLVLKPGVMQKFLKLKGKTNETQAIYSSNYSPFENGQCFYGHQHQHFEDVVNSRLSSIKLGRNGFVSAEEKMRRELQDFQERENALRLERQQSHPNKLLDIGSGADQGSLPSPKQVVRLYSVDENDHHSQQSESLVKAKSPSLAKLCDTNDGSAMELPTALALIQRFEQLQQQTGQT